MREKKVFTIEHVITEATEEEKELHIRQAYTAILKILNEKSDKKCDCAVQRKIKR